MSDKVALQADYKLTVAGTYYVQGELGKKTTKPYQEDFYLLEEHVAQGALSIIVSGFPNQPSHELSLLAERLTAKDQNFRGVRTHEIISTTRLSDRPKKSKAAHDVSLMSDDELLRYADEQALEVDFDLYDTLAEKRAAVDHCRRNMDEYKIIEAEKASRSGVAKKAAKVLKDINKLADKVLSPKQKASDKKVQDPDPEVGSTGKLAL